jgi:hypothetical protein
MALFYNSQTILLVKDKNPEWFLTEHERSILVLLNFEPDVSLGISTVTLDFESYSRTWKFLIDNNVIHFYNKRELPF